MRIGMMADIYKPHISGVTNYISLHKRYMEKLGHEVFIFTFGDSEYQDEETNVIRSPGLPLATTKARIGFRYSRSAQRLLATMDIVHVHHPFISGQLALLYCKPRSIPILFTSHTRYDLVSHAYLQLIPDSFSDVLLKAYLPAFCRSCDLVTAPSTGSRAALEHLGVDAPIEIVPNGVDLSPYQGEIAPIDRQQFGFASQDVVLIYVGRLSPEKNLPFLLRSFHGLAEAYDHVKLLLVGDGPERDNLEDRVHHMGLNDKVRFAGLVPYEMVPRYLKMADAFVIASTAETHPLSVTEAMAAGLPVVGIESPGIEDAIIDGETGFLAETEDLALFTAKLVRMATDHHHRRQMGLMAKKAVQKYAIENTVSLLVGHYQRLIQEAASRKRSLQVRWFALLDKWL